MKTLIFILMLVFCSSSALALDLPEQVSEKIMSAKRHGGAIRLVLDTGRVVDVPDDMANRHRQQLEKWLADGNSIHPRDSKPTPTRKDKIRSDPEFPKAPEYMEAMIDCQLNSDCAAAQALKARLDNLRKKYK